MYYHIYYLYCVVVKIIHLIQNLKHYLQIFYYVKMNDNVDWSQLPYEIYTLIMAYHCKNEKDYWRQISYKQPLQIKHRKCGRKIKYGMNTMINNNNTYYKPTEQSSYHYQPIPRLRLFSCPQYQYPKSGQRYPCCSMTLLEKYMNDPEYKEWFKLHEDRKQLIRDNPNIGDYYKARNHKKQVITQLKHIWWRLAKRHKAPNEHASLYYDISDDTIYSNCPSTNCYLEKYHRYAIHPKHMKYKYLDNKF